MIGMEHRDGLDCPTVYCDVCGQPIRDARYGLYAWDNFNPGEPTMLHKGECDRRYEVAAGYGSHATEELSMLPVYLGRNMDPNHPYRDGKR